MTLTSLFHSQQFTAQRKRSWAQTVLGGRPSLVGYEDLFDSGTYRDLAASDAVGSGQKLLSCVEERETEIRNNTCVLGTFSVLHLPFLFESHLRLIRFTWSVAPEVTEGPYYHNEGHLIRQNIAELQFGLLTVCSSSFMISRHTE